LFEARKHWLKLMSRQSMSVMPALENKVPDLDGKSLTRRAKRNGVVVALARATLPGQMVLRLRRVADGLGEIALNGAAPAEERVSAARAMVAVQDQLLDLLAFPRRPAAGAKGKSPAQVLDITPVSAPADLD
jgi:hypothetical protein